MSYTVVCSDEDEAAWKAHRWEMLTASQIPRLLGLVKWAVRDGETVDAAVDRMVDEYARRVEDEMGESAEYGQRVEGAILAWAAEVCPELRGWAVARSHVLMISDRWPWLGCTLDGSSAMPLAVLEVKDYSPYLAKAWSTCHACEGRCGHAETRQPRVPDYVRCQVLVQLAVTGWPRAVIVGCERGRRPRCYVVERDEAEIEAVVAEAEKAWRRIAALREDYEGRL